MPRKLRIGIIGCKNMGQKHLACLQSDFADCVRVVGILNSSVESTQKTAKELKINPFDGIMDINRRKVDAIIIATPLETHYEIAKQLIDKNIPLLIEKPFAETPEQCLELIKIANQNNVPLMVGHLENYNPAVILFKELLTEPIISIAAIRTSKNKSEKKTHIISELMIHDLAIVYSLMGNEWSEARINKNDKYKWNEHAIVELKYQSNTIIRLEALRDKNTDIKRQMRIIDAKNNIWLIRFAEGELYKNKELLCSGNCALKNELTDFINMVVQKKQSNIDAYDALDVVCLCNELENIK
ncbi:MAG: Gfo/Idh/MocA family oxidoreductase [Alphaproteobacteria bacterium]|nr:Gfo/Idh/MocA family oxidoreductase [Alphaproteobacteria bacterium]